jgi:hypothetical protein
MIFAPPGETSNTKQSHFVIPSSTASQAGCLCISRRGSRCIFALGFSGAMMTIRRLDLAAAGYSIVKPGRQTKGGFVKVLLGHCLEIYRFPPGNGRSGIRPLPAGTCGRATASGRISRPPYCLRLEGVARRADWRSAIRGSPTKKNRDFADGWCLGFCSPLSEKAREGAASGLSCGPFSPTLSRKRKGSAPTLAKHGAFSAPYARSNRAIWITPRQCVRLSSNRLK